MFPAAHRSLIALLVLLGLIGAPAQSMANGLSQSGWLQLQAFSASIDSSARVDQPQTGTPGTELRFERELGLASRKTLPAFLAGVRLGERWRAEIEHYALRRGARETVLAGELLVDDTLFPSSFTINSKFDSAVTRATAGYSFLRTPDTEVGAAIGLHVTQFDLALRGQGQVGGAQIAARSEERRRTVPLPTVGLYAATALGTPWLLSGRADLLFLKVRQDRGLLLNLSASATYRITPNLGIGGGYRFVDYQLETTRPTLRGRVEYRFHGPHAFVELGF